MGMRKIIHLDMDAFFAAIEERDDKSLVGKPVIIGSPPDVRGVVSTCNYIARKYGVHSAMSSREAYQRCPHAVFIPPHFSKYKEASDIVRSIMMRYTDKIEFVALDEGYMDVTGSELLFGPAEKIAKELQQLVYENVKTTCSVGVGYSMLSAKCASEEKKPRGFFVINNPEEFKALMQERPVKELHGVGSKTAERLASMGIKTIGQLAKASDSRLLAFGTMGVELKKHANGIDNREVTPMAPQKSIGRETTFSEDVTDRDILNDTLLYLANDIGYKLYTKKLWCKTVTLKIKFSNMKTITRAVTGEYLRDGDKIYKISNKILEETRLNLPVRLIGISTSGLTDMPYTQMSFDTENTTDKKSGLGDTLYDLKQRFGRNMVKTARELEIEKKYNE